MEPRRHEARPAAAREPVYDCTRCGACCVNARENEAEGFHGWVEVHPREPLLRRRDLGRRLVVVDEDGAAHLKLDAAGRCVALRGTLGEHVRCSIYAHRPRPCRRVQPGDASCLSSRRERGIGV